MRATEMVVCKGECQLKLEIYALLGESVDPACEPTRVLTDREIVPFHTPGRDGFTDR